MQECLYLTGAGPARKGPWKSTEKYSRKKCTALHTMGSHFCLASESREGSVKAAELKSSSISAGVSFGNRCSMRGCAKLWDVLTGWGQCGQRFQGDIGAASAHALRCGHIHTEHAVSIGPFHNPLRRSLLRLSHGHCFRCCSCRCLSCCSECLYCYCIEHYTGCWTCCLELSSGLTGCCPEIERAERPIRWAVLRWGCSGWGSHVLGAESA